MLSQMALPDPTSLHTLYAFYAGLLEVVTFEVMPMVSKLGAVSVFFHNVFVLFLNRGTKRCVHEAL